MIYCYPRKSESDKKFKRRRPETVHRGFVCHAKDPECDFSGSGKSLKCLSRIVTGCDLPSRKLLWQHYREMKNCGIKVDFQLLFLSLLAHLTKTISLSSVSNSQHWADKFSAQESAFRLQHLSWEAPWWRLSHNSHPKHCLHPAPKKESEYVLDCHPSWYLFQPNSMLVESEPVPCWGLEHFSPMLPSTLSSPFARAATGSLDTLTIVHSRCNGSQ